MSRVAATSALTITRGATWEDEFTYLEDDEITPIDLTGYSAKLQIRTEAGEFGTTTTTTLLLELTIGDGLAWDTALLGRLVINVPAADHAALNPLNAKRADYTYALEVYIPAGVNPLYTLPLARGRVRVNGWGIR